jgi:secreted PhoX family phosphatase
MPDNLTFARKGQVIILTQGDSNSAQFLGGKLYATAENQAELIKFLEDVLNKLKEENV